MILARECSRDPLKKGVRESGKKNGPSFKNKNADEVGFGAHQCDTTARKRKKTV